jgi:hypothetical protein
MAVIEIPYRIRTVTGGWYTTTLSTPSRLSASPMSDRDRMLRERSTIRYGGFSSETWQRRHTGAGLGRRSRIVSDQPVTDRRATA